MLAELKVIKLRQRWQRGLIQIIAIIVALSSAELRSSEGMEKQIWLDSAKVDCVGVGPQQCYRIRERQSDEWEYFYQEIEGFDFEPGNIYQLLVRITKRDADPLPADASSLIYSLVTVISKEADPLLPLNDIWSVYEFAQAPKKPKRAGSLNLEINIRTMQIFGNDGCNALRAQIEKLEGDELRFGPLMSTKKFCADMSDADRYQKALSAVAYFERNQNKLQMMDEQRRPLLQFKKVD